MAKIGAALPALLALGLLALEALFELLRGLPSSDPGALSDESRSASRPIEEAEVVPDDVGTIESPPAYI